MKIKQIAEEAIRSGRLEPVMEGHLFELFERSAVDETDLEAADQLIHLLLDGKVVRARSKAFEWSPSSIQHRFELQESLQGWELTPARS